MLVKVYKDNGYQTYSNVVNIMDDPKSNSIRIAQKIMKHLIIKYIKYVDIDKLEVKMI